MMLEDSSKIFKTQKIPTILENLQNVEFFLGFRRFLKYQGKYSKFQVSKWFLNF